MSKPIFHNVLNEEATLVDGRKVFLSRSLAVTVPVTVIDLSTDRSYTLISRRGSGTPDFNHYYNLVAGYLDHNESLQDAARRELWEETGFNTEDVPKENIIYDINSDPWTVRSNSTKGRQNVTARFGMIFTINNISELPKTSIEYCEENEVSESEWIDNETLYGYLASSECDKPLEHKVWAFNHYDLYREWIAFVDEKMNPPSKFTLFKEAFFNLFK